jgi:hypothetical protein
LPQPELEQLLTDILLVMKSIFQVHPVGALDPPEAEKLSLPDSRDAPLALRLFELNSSYLMMTFGRVDRDPAVLAYVLLTLKHVRSGDAKCLLLSLRIIEKLVKEMLSPQQIDDRGVRLLVNRLEELHLQDIQACEPDGDALSSHERAQSQRILGLDALRPPHGRWDVEALSAAREVSRSIPHFSVRLAQCLDNLAATQPVEMPLYRIREPLLGFPFCKRLVAALLKVVGKERRAIVTERPTFIRNEALSQDQQTGSGDQDLEVVDDIIDWARFEPELDRFNKESVMTGLKFLARRTHTLPDDEAAHIFENL